MSRSPSRVIGLLALLMGLGIFIGIVLTRFGPNGNQFFAISDFMMAIGALLNIVLAWRLHLNFRAQFPRFSQFTSTIALIGSLIVLIGSALDFSSAVLGYSYFESFALSQTRSIMVFGYALIGIWLLLRNYHARLRGTWSRRLAWLGIIAGAIMAVGLLAAPRIFVPYVSLYHRLLPELGELFGDLGWMLFYPIWGICFGLVFLKGPFGGQYWQNFVRRSRSMP